jgi:hypothetical protein
MDDSKNDSIPNDMCSVPSASIPLAPLLNLPLELFLQIWDSLPLQTQASLTLTCRPLYISYGHFTLPKLGRDSSHSRTYRSYLLRLLRRDLAGSSQWLCYACLQFHSCAPTENARDSTVLLHGRIWTHNPVEGRPAHLLRGSGFPYCNSAFTLSQDYIASLLRSGDDAQPTVYEGSNRIESKTYAMTLDYTIKVDVGFQGLETWSEYIYRIPNGTFQRLQWSEPAASEVNSLPEEEAMFLFGTNHEFCPHLWLGEDFVKGDGSLSAKLEASHYYSWTAYYGRDLPEFECRECHVNIKIRVMDHGAALIRVWQYYKPEVLKAAMRPAKLDGLEWGLGKKEPQERRRREVGLRRLFCGWRR